MFFPSISRPGFRRLRRCMITRMYAKSWGGYFSISSSFGFFFISISRTNFPGREGWVRRGVRCASWHCLGPDSTGVTGSVSCGNPCSCLRDTRASRTGHVASLHCLGHCIAGLDSYTWALSPSGGYRSLGSLTTTPHYVGSRYEHSFTISTSCFLYTHTWCCAL